MLYFPRYPLLIGTSLELESPEETNMKFENYKTKTRLKKKDITANLKTHP